MCTHYTIIYPWWDSNPLVKHSGALTTIERSSVDFTYYKQEIRILLLTNQMMLILKYK